MLSSGISMFNVAVIACVFVLSEVAVEALEPKLSKNRSSINVAGYDFGVRNIPGVDWKRPGKVNQDAWFRDDGENFDPPLSTSRKYSIVGVLDGHGKFGHELSDYFASNMASEIRQQLISNLQPVPELEQRLETLAGYKPDTNVSAKPLLALINGFNSVHLKAMEDPSIKTGRNGATCITCLLDEAAKKCHVAYSGDSRAIRFSDTLHTISVIAEETTVQLPSERERIEAREGSIRGNNVFYGPVGIAMTRALGDAVMIRAGVIPTPLVCTVDITGGDFIVLATDGIWDVLTDEDVRDTVLENKGAKAAADAIAEKAKKRWLKDLPIMDEEKADDITVMVLSWERGD
jgi:serine/threonine protein phosphatase PrpC